MSIHALSWALQQKCGSPTLKLILIALADRCGDDYTCWPSFKRLSKDCELSSKAIRNNIKQLSEKGLVEIIHRKRDDGSYTSNIYKLPINTPPTEREGVPHEEGGGRERDTVGVGNDVPPIEPVSKNHSRTKKKDTNKLVSKEKPLNDSDYGRYGEHLNVLLTEQEYDKLLNGWKGSAGYMLQTLLDAGIEKLSRYMASNGKKYKSHYATMQGWVWKDVMREYGINIEGWHSSKWKMPYWLRGDKEKINWFSFSEAEREEYYDNATLSGQIRCIEDALRSSGKWTPEMVWWETNGRRPENV